MKTCNQCGFIEIQKERSVETGKMRHCFICKYHPTRRFIWAHANTIRPPYWCPLKDDRESENEPMDIFEVVDITDTHDEGMYFTLGLWLSLEDALAAFDKVETPDGLIYEYEDRVDIEIRQKVTGWNETGKVVAKIEWVMIIPEMDDYIEGDKWEQRIILIDDQTNKR